MMSAQVVQEHKAGVEALLKIIADPEKAKAVLAELDSASVDVAEKVNEAQRQLAEVQKAKADLADRENAIAKRENEMAANLDLAAMEMRSAMDAANAARKQADDFIAAARK